MKRTLFFICIYTFAIILVFNSCSLFDIDGSEANQRFEKISSEQTNIHFSNDLTFTKELNPYTYRNFFNGGGVAAGDINNDGLIDIYFTGNQVSNKLYLNKGDFNFEDITEKAGVAVNDVWSTGTIMVDINGDGLLDIYVAKSGSPGGKNRHNELFVNNGDLTFTEKSAEYGLDITGLATDAMFFDYDRDGDLDVYLLNNSFEALENIDIKKGLREIYDEKGGDRLFRNEFISHSKAEGKSEQPKQQFVEVTKEAGIYSSKIGFGLDIAVSDLNSDGWPDMYISNDFFERDYLYLNNGDGTFSEILPQLMSSISLSSMGADVADINHDGRPDIYVTDMLPESGKRIKSKTDFDSWEEYQKRVNEDYHHQFVRNTLQLNNGYSQLTGRIDKVPDSLQLNVFSEISRMSGIEATDWSWTTLIADFNNDGNNDIYVTNGILKDLTDQDYVNDRRNLDKLKAVVEEDKPVSILFDEMPSSPISNYGFAGTDSLNFVDKTTSWGLDTPGFSNGAVYADLNNDGALDLIVNNINEEAAIYRNSGNYGDSENRWLMIQLKGESSNTSAIGSSVKLWSDGNLFYREQMPGRGFQSSVDHRIHFGLGENEIIDSVLVTWPDGSTSVREDIESNQILKFTQQDADPLKEQYVSTEGHKKNSLFQNVTDDISIDFVHEENSFVDFQRNKLLFHKRSTKGPLVCIADINDDGLDDFYIGGAKGQAGKVFIQQSNYEFTTRNNELFVEDKDSEDTACTWLDADGDGFKDLYVASGSSEFPESSNSLSDRLYFNNGDSFTKSDQSLPSSSYEATSVVKAVDFNQDGYLDLFTGTQLKPFAYGLPVNGNLLLSDGIGNFKNVTPDVAPELLETGLITDAAWFDYDNDNDKDLIIVGEWMPIKVFKNNYDQTGETSFNEVTSELGLGNTKGLWQSIKVDDLDGDNNKDIIVGNIGTNTRLKASTDYPLKMWVNDFDKNGSIEQIIAYTNEDGSYPYALRNDMIDQIPLIENKFPSYESYADKPVEQIISEEDQNSSVTKEVNTLESIILWNDGNGGFTEQKINQYGQFSSVYGIETIKDREDNRYLILGGNLFGVKPEIGRYDASYGSVFKVNSKKDLKYIGLNNSGIELHGEVRGIYSLKTHEDTLILVTRNDNEPLWFIKN